MKSKILVLLSSLVVALAVPAQNPVAVGQLQNDQQRRALQQSATIFQDGDAAPELYPGEDSDVGPQSVIRSKPRPTLFQAMADVQYLYTDNVLQTENNEIDTGELISTVEFALAPTAYEMAGGALSPRVGYRHQWFNFGLDGEEFPFTSTDLSDMDFNAQTVFSDIRWSRANWTVMLGFDLTRLMSSSDYNEFYKEAVPRWGVEKAFPLCQQATFAVGYAGDYRFTDTDTFGDRDFNDRTDHAVYANLSIAPCKNTVIQPFYQYRYTYFTAYKVFGVLSEDRNDHFQTFGIALYYIVCPNFNIRGFVGYQLLNSDARFVPDYKQLDAGGGVSLSLRF